MPAGDPITLQVMNALVTLLSAITAGPDYDTTVAEVKIGDGTLNTNQAISTPGIVVRPGTSGFLDSDGRGSTETLSNGFEVVLDLYLSTLVDPYPKLMKFERDVLEALLADERLGGLVMRLYPVRSTPFLIGPETNPLHGSEIRLHVGLRSPRSNLNQQG